MYPWGGWIVRLLEGSGAGTDASLVLAAARALGKGEGPVRFWDEAPVPSPVIGTGVKAEDACWVHLCIASVVGDARACQV